MAPAAKAAMREALDWLLHARVPDNADTVEDWREAAFAIEVSSLNLDFLPANSPAQRKVRKITPDMQHQETSNRCRARITEVIRRHFVRVVELEPALEWAWLSKTLEEVRLQSDLDAAREAEELRALATVSSLPN